MRNKIKNNKIKAILISILIILLIFIGAYYANERLNGIVASYENNYMNAGQSECPYGYMKRKDPATGKESCYHPTTGTTIELNFECPYGYMKRKDPATGKESCYHPTTGTTVELNEGDTNNEDGCFEACRKSGLSVATCNQECADTNESGGGAALFNGFFCSDFTSSTLYTKYIKTAIALIQIIAPILVIAFGTKDILMAVTASNEDKMKKAQKDFVKRIIIAVIIIFLPIIVRAIFSLIEGSICGV